MFGHRSSTGVWKDATIARRRDSSELSGNTWIDLQWVKRRSDDGLSWIHVWPLPAASVSDRVLSVGSDPAIPDDQVLICGVQLNADGQLYIRSGNTYTALESWLTRGTADQFYIRASRQNSYTPVLGFALDTWHPAPQSPEWYVSATQAAPADSLLLIEVAVLDTSAALTDTTGSALTTNDGQPLLIAGQSYAVIDTANIRLRAGI